MIERLRNIIKKAPNKGRDAASSSTGVISKSVIAGFIPRDPIIVEAGAHIGLDTVELAELFPRGKIYAFEPIPPLYEQLVAQTKTYTNVVCYALALGAFTGTTSMYISSGELGSSSSVLRPKEHLLYHPNVRFDEQLVVNCVTLDDWVSDVGIPKIDFLWLDLQGYELHVLKSAVNVLKSVKAIYTEVNLKELYEGTPLYDELRAWMATMGFRVEHEALPWADAGNVLFVRKKAIR